MAHTTLVLSILLPTEHAGWQTNLSSTVKSGSYTPVVLRSQLGQLDEETNALVVKLSGWIGQVLGS